MTIFKETTKTHPRTLNRQKIRTELNPNTQFHALQESYDQEMRSFLGWEIVLVRILSQNQIQIISPGNYTMDFEHEEINTHPYNTSLLPVSPIRPIAELRRIQANLGFGSRGKIFDLHWEPTEKRKSQQ